VDPTPDPACDQCPENPLAFWDAPRAVSALEAIDTTVGIVLAVIAVVLLIRRWRRASPGLRRALWPVLIAGGAALAALVITGLVSQFVSSGAGDAFSPVFLACFAAVPIAFLLGILRIRLARSSVSDLVVALDAGEPLRGALAGALGDPELDIVYWLDWRRGLGGAGWVDPQGQSVPEPTATESRSVKLVARKGERVAAIVYDRELDGEPELVEAVTAAAALALQNDRLQAELRAEVSFITTVTNTAPSLLVNIGTDGRIRSINAAALEAAGIADEEAARGRHYWELFIDPRERDAMIARFHALAPDYPAGEYENTFTNARGEERTIYWRAAPTLDISGRVLSIISGGLDITERRKRELELERERDATTTTLESIPSIAVVLDRSGTIRDRDLDDPRVGANRAFRQALGWRDHELVGRPFVELLSEDDDTPAVAAIATAAAGGVSEEVESEFRCADGSRRAFAWTAVPVADVTGRTDALVLVSGVEVTERRRLEVEKERERAFLNAIANNAPSLLCLVDREGRLTQGGANIAFEQTLGYLPEQIGGQVLWEEFIDPAEAEEVRELVESVAAGAASREHDNTWLTSAGEQLSVAWTCTPLPEIDERSLLLVTGVDITERKRISEDLRASRVRLVRAEDDARRVLERNLHDGAQQRLVALSVALRVIEGKLRGDPDGASALLSGALEELAQALAELRELARGIHPAVLTDRGLRPALEALAARAPIPIELVTADERFPSEVEAAAYYVVSETLTNVAKYAQATSARVEVGRWNGVLRILVSDDGVGGADPADGSGIRGLVDRVAVLDGSFEIESPAGAGTFVRAEIPLTD
jgi:PAS domain S-box-containing protein